jgi:C4-type Zn-finger protein
MTMDTSKHLITCPVCKQSLKVNVAATRIPQHSNPKLPSSSCPGSRNPIIR